jgi:hypothetical protein
MITHFIALKTSYPDVQAVTFQAQFSGHSILFIFTLYWILSLSLDRAKMFAVVLLSRESANGVISKT